jgi:ribosomal protein S27AE
MISGKCPKCGHSSYGWFLVQPRNQSCPKCGTGLLITQNEGKVTYGYSPFTAVEYKIKLPYSATSTSPESTSSLK